MVDKAKLDQMLGNLRRYRGTLRELAAVGRTAFLANADSFIVLIENDWLPANMREPLTAMARFRNRLVHLYWDIEDERLFQYLAENPDDMDVLVAELARRLA